MSKKFDHPTFVVNYMGGPGCEHLIYTNKKDVYTKLPNMFKRNSS